MGSTVFPAPSAASKTMFRTTLTSGTSYTVPAGVTYLNVTLYGGGGSGGTYNSVNGNTGGTTTFTGATSAPGGVGGAGISGGNTMNGLAAQANSSQGGQVGQYISSVTMFRGQQGYNGSVISSTLSVTPGASISYAIGAGGASAPGSADSGAGGSGKIDIEYWV
jgi:hypothetical protein